MGPAPVRPSRRVVSVLLTRLLAPPRPRVPRRPLLARPSFSSPLVGATPLISTIVPSTVPVRRRVIPLHPLSVRPSPPLPPLFRSRVLPPPPLLPPRPPLVPRPCARALCPIACVPPLPLPSLPEPPRLSSLSAPPCRLALPAPHRRVARSLPTRLDLWRPFVLSLLSFVVAPAGGVVVEVKVLVYNKLLVIAQIIYSWTTWRSLVSFAGRLLVTFVQLRLCSRRSRFLPL